MKKQDIIFILFLIFSTLSYSQVSVNATVSCPPCRPIEGCRVCWENQEQADQCEQSTANFIKGITPQEKVTLIVQTNPISDGNLSLVSSVQMSGRIMIYNQLGALVKSVDLQGRKSNYISLKLNLESGLYFLVYYDYMRKEKITKKLLFTNM